MSDLISRQAAIDALDEQIALCNKALGSFDISMKDEYAVKVERRTDMNEDTISRQKAVEKLRRNKSLFCKNRVEFQILSETDKSRVDEIDTCIAELLNLPSAQPEQRWIPVSERLPEAPGFVNCTCHSLIDNREDWVVETFYMPHPSGSPYSDWGNIPMLNDGKCEVVAWMYRNIPEPYKAGM